MYKMGINNHFIAVQDIKHKAETKHVLSLGSLGNNSNVTVRVKLLILSDSILYFMLIYIKNINVPTSDKAD